VDVGDQVRTLLKLVRDNPLGIATMFEQSGLYAAVDVWPVIDALNP
jgi:hypothetical protein